MYIIHVLQYSYTGFPGSTVFFKANDIAENGECVKRSLTLWPEMRNPSFSLTIKIFKIMPNDSEARKQM